MNFLIDLGVCELKIFNAHRIALRTKVWHLHGIDTSQPFDLAALGRDAVARTAQLEAA